MSTRQPDHPVFTLQQQAIERARLALESLPGENALFQPCLSQGDAVIEMNFSGVVDVAVQTQAGVGCPIWAPVKFVLQISNYHSEVAEHVLTMFLTISETLPRLQIYEKLNNDPALQTALLNIYTDVLEFPVRIYRHLSSRCIVRFCMIMATSLKKDLGNMIQRLQGHAKDVDNTAMATELQRNHEFRDEQLLKDKQDLKLKLEMRLKPANMREIPHHNLQEKLAGTNEWIWSHPTFLRWKNTSTECSADRLLCVSGTPGCGKTILASSVVQSMKSSGHQVVYFSFSGTDADRQSLGSLVRSFLFQLLQGSTDRESFDLMRDLMSGDQPTNPELWDAFSRVAGWIPDSMYWVIDGIDECKEPTLALINQFVDLLHIHKKTRAILLGRQHVFASVTSKSIIEITPDLTKSDIDAFIDRQLSMSAKLTSPDIRERAFSTLQERSNGMFLWVRFAVEDLNRSSSKVEFIGRLQNIPKGLQQIYRHLLSRTMERLDDIDLKFFRHILALIIAARRPLNHDELQYVHAIISRSASISSDVDSIEDHMVDELARKILAVCGSLVSVTNGVVSLVHVSAQEFLTRRDCEWKCEDDRKIACLRIDPEESHHLLGSACLDYLSIGGYGFPLVSGDSSILWSQHPLLQYASKNVICHLNRAGTPSPNLVQRIKSFFESEACLSWVEFFLIHLLGDGSTGLGDQELNTFLSTLHDLHQINLLECFLKVLYREHDNRTLKFGEGDWRANQTMTIIELLSHHDDTPSRSTPTYPHTVDTDVGEGQRDSRRTVSEMMEILSHRGQLAMPKQVDFLLKLELLFQRTSVLTDPLELLFRMILQKTALLPVYALISVGHFYRKVDKYERNWIGITQNFLNLYQDAEEMFRQARRGRATTLGMDHYDTLYSTTWLGLALHSQGKYEEAGTMYRRAMEGLIRTLGSKHKSTLAVSVALELVLEIQNKREQANTVIRQSVAEIERLLEELQSRDTGSEDSQSLNSTDDP